MIREWQEDPAERLEGRYVCALCARSLIENKAEEIDGEHIGFSLLRDDYLPSAALPRTYILEAYWKAILHADGLLDRHQKGVVWRLHLPIHVVLWSCNLSNLC